MTDALPEPDFEVLVQVLATGHHGLVVELGALLVVVDRAGKARRYIGTIANRRPLGKRKHGPDFTLTIG